MTEGKKDIPASIHARLLNEAKRLNKPFSEISQYYGMERFLYRLSKTTYADKFILKGGLLFYCWETPLRRPTKDIDFRGYELNSKENIAKIIGDICNQSLPEDGLSFDIESLKLIETQVDADYLGIRASFIGYLGKVKIHMQLDIGFSDQITPDIVKIEFPSILSRKAGTKLKGYPPETVISEKFHAIVYLGEINSRMKDFYDLWLLSKNFEFDSQVLQQAIQNTFIKRSTILNRGRPVGLTQEFAIRNQESWKIFLKKNRIITNEIIEFSKVIEEIWSLLELPIEGMHKKKSLKDHRWFPGRGWE